MKAKLVVDRRTILSEQAFTEIVVWEVPAPLPASKHKPKYRLALVVNQACVLRYDNEPRKGDHRHVGDREKRYGFETLEQLFADFEKDTVRWLNENGNA